MNTWIFIFIDNFPIFSVLSNEILCWCVSQWVAGAGLVRNLDTHPPLLIISQQNLLTDNWFNQPQHLLASNEELLSGMQTSTQNIIFTQISTMIYHDRPYALIISRSNSAQKNWLCRKLFFAAADFCDWDGRWTDCEGRVNTN